jgi:hypothetical protein
MYLKVCDYDFVINFQTENDAGMIPHLLHIATYESYILSIENAICFSILPADWLGQFFPSSQLREIIPCNFCRFRYRGCLALFGSAGKVFLVWSGSGGKPLHTAPDFSGSQRVTSPLKTFGVKQSRWGTALHRHQISPAAQPLHVGCKTL